MSSDPVAAVIMLISFIVAPLLASLQCVGACVTPQGAEIKSKINAGARLPTVTRRIQRTLCDRVKVYTRPRPSAFQQPSPSYNHKRFAVACTHLCRKGRLVGRHSTLVTPAVVQPRSVHPTHPVTRCRLRAHEAPLRARGTRDMIRADDDSAMPGACTGAGVQDRRSRGSTKARAGKATAAAPLGFVIFEDTAGADKENADPTGAGVRVSHSRHSSRPRGPLSDVHHRFGPHAAPGEENGVRATGGNTDSTQTRPTNHSKRSGLGVALDGGKSKRHSSKRHAKRPHGTEDADCRPRRHRSSKHRSSRTTATAMASQAVIKPNKVKSGLSMRPKGLREANAGSGGGLRPVGGAAGGAGGLAGVGARRGLGGSTASLGAVSFSLGRVR